MIWAILILLLWAAIGVGFVCDLDDLIHKPSKFGAGSASLSSHGDEATTRAGTGTTLYDWETEGAA